MISDPGKDIGQPGPWINIIELGGDDQRIHEDGGGAAEPSDRILARNLSFLGTMVSRLSGLGRHPMLKVLRQIILNVTQFWCWASLDITHDNVLYHAYLDQPKDL